MPSGQPSGSSTKTAIVTGALIALVAGNVYTYVQMDHVRTDLANTREGIAAQIATLRETSSVTSASQRKHLETLKEELEAARKQARESSAQAKADATKRAEQLTAQLAAEQKRMQQQVTGEISEVKQAATTANTKIESVSGEVGTVKTDLSSTKSELEKTIADLKRTNGDLGVQSGLIATNAHELAALKRLGERNYFEFNLGKTKQPQRVGDITLLLKKTDPKRNKYTIEVMADDKKYEKKDKNTNEPVQFYTAKARQPYEIVVNTVKKDQIVGYLATPKEQASR